MAMSSTQDLQKSSVLHNDDAAAGADLKKLGKRKALNDDILLEGPQKQPSKKQERVSPMKQQQQPDADVISESEDLSGAQMEFDCDRRFPIRDTYKRIIGMLPDDSEDSSSEDEGPPPRRHFPWTISDARAFVGNAGLKLETETKMANDGADPKLLSLKARETETTSDAASDTSETKINPFTFKRGPVVKRKALEKEEEERVFKHGGVVLITEADFPPRKISERNAALLEEAFEAQCERGYQRPFNFYDFMPHCHSVFPVLLPSDDEEDDPFLYY